MRAILASLFSVLFFTHFAVAAEQSDAMTSEFFHQANAGQSELTASATYTYAAVTLEGTASVSAYFNGLVPVSLSYEYGLNKMFSVGATLAYGYEDVKFSDASRSIIASGFADPSLFVKANMDGLYGRLHFLVSTTLGLQYGHLDSSGNETTLSDGAYSPTLQVGWDRKVGPGMLGGRVSYLIQGESVTTQDNNSNQYGTGGNQLNIAAFYELTLGQIYLVGGDLQYTGYEESDNSTDVSTPSKNAPYGLFTAEAYSRITLGSTEFLPKLSLVGLGGGSQYSSYAGVNATVAARWAF